MLSRYREFAADAGAVALTGSPAALASALTKVSAGLLAIPSRDLREVAVRDAFHLLPPRATESRLPASHPPLRPASRGWRSWRRSCSPRAPRRGAD